MYADAQNARDESDRATQEAILKSLVTGTELYKAFLKIREIRIISHLKSGCWILYLQIHINLIIGINKEMCGISVETDTAHFKIIACKYILTKGYVGGNLMLEISEQA